MAGFFKLAIGCMWVWFVTMFWFKICSGVESDGHPSSDILFLPFKAKDEVEMVVGLLLSGMLWVIILFSYFAILIMGAILSPILKAIGWEK